MAYVERNKEELLSRLKKIEGQIRGIQKMIEEDRYCVDILLQISATRAALQKVALSLLRSHTRGCVTQAIRENRENEAIEELMQLLDKFAS